MIASATRDYNVPNAKFSVVDCRYLEKEPSIVAGIWDKVYGVLYKVVPASSSG
jgi:hypothetical protein